MNAYIDAGSYQGTTVRSFIAAVGPDIHKWEIHAFEANPNIVAQYPPEVQYHQQAVWTCDGKVEFYVGQRNPEVDGASLIRAKRTGHLDTKHPVLVPCVDFAGFLTKNFRPEDNVVVKMNIEGAEYRVLTRMLETGAIGVVDDLYLEAHYEKIGVSKAENDRILSAVAAATNLHTMQDFYARYR